MIIRLADLEKDALAIVEGAKDFATRTPVNKLLQGQNYIDAVTSIVTLDEFELIVAEHEGKVVGGIGLFYAPFLWNRDILIAEEHFWWTDKEAPFSTGMKLIKRAMENIDKRNAIPMFKTLSTSHKGVGKVYRKYGMEPVETLYMRVT